MLSPKHRVSCMGKLKARPIVFDTEPFRISIRTGSTPNARSATINGTRHPKPLIIVIAGGSGSGKSTLVQRIIAEVGCPRVGSLVHDSYYRDWPNLTLDERPKLNYDHPQALENDLLVKHLEDLIARKGVDVPIYDFSLHARCRETRYFAPCDVIILEGILSLQDERIRELADVKIYVDTDADVRFMRRLIRDVEERNRTVNNVINQYLTTVRPMHEKFVQPCALAADIIVPGGGYNQVAAELIVNKIKSYLTEIDAISAAHASSKAKIEDAKTVTPLTSAETEVWDDVPKTVHTTLQE